MKKYLLLFLISLGGMQWANADGQCSNNFNNTNINNSRINNINIVCTNGSLEIPKLEGKIQPWTFSDFEENGLLGSEGTYTKNLADFLGDHLNEIVYLSIYPYYTVSDINFGKQNIDINKKFCFYLSNIMSYISPSEYCFSSLKGVAIHPRLSSRMIEGYFSVDQISGPYQGSMSYGLTPISTQEIYQILGGKPKLVNESKKYEILITKEDVYKKYNLSNKDIMRLREEDDSANTMNYPNLHNSLLQNECALIVASRKTIPEVRDYIRDNISDRRYLKVYQASNGWYAISIGTLKPHEEKPVMTKWKASGKIPQDSFCSSGEKLINTVAWE